MTTNGRFAPGSFSAQERTDRCWVCLAPICVMSVYQGWEQDIAPPFQGGVGVGCERSELLPYRP